LPFTTGGLFGVLMKQFGNPENLTLEEIIEKYKHSDKVPYWQGKECDLLIDKILTDEKIQKDLPLIKNANSLVNKVDKIIPVVSYITIRPRAIFEITKQWLNKNNFPKAPVILKPRNIDRKIGTKWKAKVLEYLYPEVVGIVDDNPSLVKNLSKSYKGTVFLYDHSETERKDIKVVPCKDWNQVLKMVKKNF
jgi:predicted AAA+ superfamily ATPase